jgi:PAS domain S-box-containing protein
MDQKLGAHLERDLVAPLLHRVLLTIVIAALLTASASAIANNAWMALWGFGNAVIAGILLCVARRGYPRVASMLEALVLVATTINSLISGYGLLDVGILIFPGLFLLTSVLLSARWIVIVVIITDAAVVSVGLAEKWGWLVTPTSNVLKYDDIFDAVILLTTTAAFVQYLVATMRRSIVTARLAHRRTRDILDATSDAILIHDASDGRILEVNEPALKMFACDRHELLGQVSRNPANSDSTPYIDKAAEYIQRTLSEGPQVFEWLARSQDGSAVWVEVILRSANISDEPCVVAVLRDITARRHLEQRVREAEMFRAVGQLAGGVAHDFNNQLTGIFGNAEFLREGVEQDVELRKCADSILISARRAADLTQQLLAFARRGRHRSLPVDLHQLIVEVIALGHRSIDKRIAIEQHMCAGYTVTVGDPSALQNALLNLLLNARDAMAHGGTVRFTTCNVDIPRDGQRESIVALSAGRYIEICVSDTGCGIARDNICRVFEPFFTTKDSGTGMGLAAVQGTVLEHQGTVEVISEVGKGSTFRLMLPVIEEVEPLKTVSPPTPPAPSAQGRILVVDDESSITSLVQRVLERRGYEVEICSGGQQAIDRYQPKRFDLVLLDVMMPDLDGVQVLQRLRKGDPQARVMLMTGNAEENVRARLREFSDVVVISKPFLPKELIEQIQNLTAAISH